MFTKAVKKANLLLSPEHIGFCKSSSYLIALYRRIDYRTAEERVISKLYGYLKALEDCGILSNIDTTILFEYYASRDRSKEETE